MRYMVVTFTCTSLDPWTSLGMVVILLDGVLTATVRHGVLSFGWRTPADDSRKMRFLAFPGIQWTGAGGAARQ